MKKWLKIIFIQKWANLQKIGKDRFVHSMYIWIFIVPLIAKTFEGIGDEALNFVVFEQPIKINPTLPFSWQIFYFSALFFALGNLIIKVYCPKLIQDHLSYKSYIDEGKTLKQLEEYSDDINFDWGDLADSIDKRLTRLNIGHAEGNGGTEHKYESLSSEDPVYYFWPIFKVANVKHTVSRCICTFLYVLGFLLFSLVVFQNTIVVIQFIMK